MRLTLKEESMPAEIIELRHLKRAMQCQSTGEDDWVKAPAAPPRRRPPRPSIRTLEQVAAELQVTSTGYGIFVHGHLGPDIEVRPTLPLCA